MRASPDLLKMVLLPGFGLSCVCLLSVWELWGNGGERVSSAGWRGGYSPALTTVKKNLVSHLNDDNSSIPGSIGRNQENRLSSVSSIRARSGEFAAKRGQRDLTATNRINLQTFQ